MDNIRVLLIEDDEDDYLLTRALFAEMDEVYHLDWCDTYEVGLARVYEQAHDLYLLDYRIGAYTGLDLLHELRASQNPAPAILLTGQGERETDVAAMRAGAADFLQKDHVDARTLERSIRYALERATTLRQLRASEARYRAIVEDQTEFITRFDSTGTLTFVNEALARYHGCAADDMLGQPFAGLTDPRDRQALQNVMNMLAPAQPTATIECRVANRDYTWNQWTVRRLGNGEEYQAVGHDVSERKRAEEDSNRRLGQMTTLRRVDRELTRTLNMDSVLNLAIDSSMRLSRADHGFIGLVEDARLNLAKVIGPYNHHETERFLQQGLGTVGDVLRSQQPARFVHDRPQKLTTLPGMRAQFIIPLMSQDRFLGVINLETNKPERFGTDTFEFLQLVTARIAAALENAQLFQVLQKQLDELRALYEQVSELEKLKTNIIRVAAHDLRNPIGVILGYVDLLHDPKTPLEIPKYADSISRAAIRMREIIDNLLALERLPNLDDMEPIDLSALVRTAYDEHIAQAETKNQTYELLVPDLPTCINGHQAYLHGAVSNLISNALKYTPEGGHIEVMLESDGDAATVAVADNGFGIPKEHQHRLFQPFSRIQTEETQRIVGTGLGLHLVKNIIERHNGRMRFRSTYGEGSTFGFQIPVREQNC